MCVCVCVCVLQPWVLYWTPKWHRKKGRHKFLPPTHGRMLKESEFEYKSHYEPFCSILDWMTQVCGHLWLWITVYMGYSNSGKIWDHSSKQKTMFSKGGMEGIHEGVKKGFLKDSSLWGKRKAEDWRGGWKWWYLWDKEAKRFLCSLFPEIDSESRFFLHYYSLLLVFSSVTNL